MARRLAQPPLFVTDDKFPDVIAELEARGWKRFPHDAFPKFDLKWNNYSKIAWSRVAEHQIVNHFQHAVVLSRKDTLADRLYRVGDPSADVDSFYARTFDLHKPGEAIRLARWFLYAKAVAVLKRSIDAVDHNNEVIDTAIAFLTHVVNTDGFFSLGGECGIDPTSTEWSPLTKPRQSPPETHQTPIDHSRVSQLLDQLQENDPQFGLIEPGHGDVWICKPSNLSQGRGIHLLTDLDHILSLCQSQEEGTKQSVDGDDGQQPDNKPVTPCSWIAQKYVERPLLLQGGHKFDIRQWVLITSLNPLTVYWYDKCYLRFCSSRYTLDNASIDDSFTHLSNYSIQKNASPSSQADLVDSMWHSDKFREYLQDTYGYDAWNSRLVPQMKHATRVALEAALVDMVQVGRGFEWLGIDFLVDADLRVWLLEVNVSPDVSHSTPVTAELVPEATRGVFDLVLGEDSARPRKAPSGWIEMT